MRGRRIICGRNWARNVTTFGDEILNNFASLVVQNVALVVGYNLPSFMNFANVTEADKL